MKNTLMFSILLVFTLVGCSTKRPILYPNAHLKSVGIDQANRDIEECCRLADVLTPV